ncbi:hypothetical protein C8R46DRAFT_1040480 [Mycena filopes]|nr:hypothetical protein C8R46DRAFT_1040480 [Mycena filopes]
MAPPRPGAVPLTFYRSNLIDIEPWSTAWENNDQQRFFGIHDEWHDLSEFDFFVKRLMKVPGTIHPIAFHTRAIDPRILFEADNQYYEINIMDGCLVRYGAGFSSADDFLARLPRLQRVVEKFPRNCEKLYGDTAREQERLAEAAYENLSDFPRCRRLDLDPWSTDWENNDQQYFFEVRARWHNLSELDFFVKRLMKVPGTILPIAFYTHAIDPCVLFEADGEYYEIDLMHCRLVRYGVEFASADDFLEQLPLLRGAVERFPKHSDELYGATWREQRRLTAAAYKNRDKSSLPPSPHLSGSGLPSALAYTYPPRTSGLATQILGTFRPDTFIFLSIAQGSNSAVVLTSHTRPTELRFAELALVA